MYHVLKDNDINLLIAVFLYYFYHSLTIINFYYRKHNSDDENTNPNSNRDSKVAKSTSTVKLHNVSHKRIVLDKVIVSLFM